MIAGIGTDIIEIARIEAAYGRHGRRFAERILGPQELLKFERRLARASSRGMAFLATRFAAKEAFSKAIGLGMHMPMYWRAIEVVNEPSGATSRLGARWCRQPDGRASLDRFRLGVG